MTIEIINAGTVRCSRLLSQNGTVMVFAGQTVDPSMVIAFRKTWTKHFSIDLKHELGLSAGERVRDYLLIEEGDFVSINEAIAKREGKRPRSLVASFSGRFLGISSGCLIFEQMPESIEKLIAGFPGMVTDVIPCRGAILETNGSFIPGIWGNGKAGQGILLSVDMEKEGLFSLDSISIDLAGAVVFANSCNDADALRAAAKMSPGGLIFGSLSSSLLPIAMDLPFPVIVTDMIGAGKISNPIYLALAENIIKFAYLYAPLSTPGRYKRPEIIIPRDEYQPEEQETLEISVGCQVRIIEGFYSGEIGYVTEILKNGFEAGEQPVPEIESMDQIRVCIDQDLEIVIPANNLEVINVKTKE